MVLKGLTSLLPGQNGILSAHLYSRSGCSLRTPTGSGKTLAFYPSWPKAVAAAVAGVTNAETPQDCQSSHYGGYRRAIDRKWAGVRSDPTTPSAVATD
jgi:hypothetical protein